MRAVRAGFAFVTAAFLAMSALPAQATPVLVTSRAALGGDDFYDWGPLGSPGTIAGFFDVTSDDGRTAWVDNPAGSIERRDQGPGSWNGNFAPGDALLWTRTSGGAIEVVFDQPVFGAGAQVEADLGPDFPFTAVLDVFDVADNLIASFNLAGIAGQGGDNSAIFIGALDDQASIKWIRFTTFNAVLPNFRDFAINRLDIVAAVPEPATVALLGAGLLGLGIARRRRERVGAAQ